MYNNYTFNFADEVLQEKTENVLDDLFKIFPDKPVISHAISYAQAVALTKGAYSDTIKEFIDVYHRKPEMHKNAKLFKHENAIMKRIANAVTGRSVTKLYNEIRKWLDLIVEEEYHYNVVYYGSPF